MTDAGEHALRVLEFPRVLELVARHATSELGAARVRSLRPLRRRAAVRKALASAAEMRAFLREADPWSPPPVPAAGKILEKLAVEGSVLEGEELARVGDLLASTRVARRDLPGGDSERPGLGALAESLGPAPDLERRLERSLDRRGRVADEASSRLRELRSDLRSERSALVGRLERFSRRLSDRFRVEDASVTLRGGRYCIPIRREGRSRVGGIVHDESASGRTLFVEPPAAIDSMNRIRELESEEEREVRRILGELTDRLRPRSAALTRDLETLVELDSLYARARWAREHGGAEPEIGGSARGEGYRAVGACHPLLRETEESPVPFDLTLEPGERVLLVSGPNAGGKTVLLKTIGLLSALTQSGVVPPAEPGTRLPLFRRFFAIIGDEQSIEASLSTFSAQVRSLRTILEESDGATLVLLDEFGSHTDPTEGAALASAVLIRLAERAGLTVASTHLGALKALAGEDPAIVNASLQFDPDALRPTFHLRRDRPGRSYALEIARRLGVPEDVLVEARSRLGAGERRMEAVLSDLEEREDELAGRGEEVAARVEELKRRGTRLEERERALDRREREIERAARGRAAEYLLEARSKVEAAIERLEREYAETAGRRKTAEAPSGRPSPGEIASAARSAVEEAVRESREARPEPGPAEERPEEEAGPPPELEVGDAVRILSLERRGKVRELRGERTVVEAGGVRLTLPNRDLRPADGETGGEGGGDGRTAGHQPLRPRSDSGTRPELEARSEINLHGLRTHEVEAALLPALDAAVVADLPHVRIIHGKGTGALRQRVREVLRADGRVSGVRSGGFREGGSGVTVATLGGREDGGYQ